MTQSVGWEIGGIHLLYKRKKVHMEEPKTEKHKGMGGKLSVYGEKKESPSESIWLKQEDVAMTEDQERSRMTKVIGLNDKWLILLMVIIWEMKAGLRSMVPEGFGFDHAEWCWNAQGMAVETINTESWIDGDRPYKGLEAHQCL